MSMAAAEGDRRVANVVQIGTVTDVDAATSRARVKAGEIEGWFAVAHMRAGALSFWWMPAVGEQVVVVVPSGEAARGVILAGIYAGNAPSSDPATPMIELGGGKLVVNGDIEVNGEVTANGIALSTHVHGGVMPGGGNTGGPQ
ncbi:phage baseplate assembly protein V [Maritimibacter sp. HL-12]|uniref:phage baseplate assembly protein V n=1 Tax=Maritimibacter sp. HL-12 TaxID=1162418 RepID=UPI000A0F3028|nr:phage baseplate assembly protein V [Maritimibacter sp. HL-12]SMH35820.1 phage baseplate assembly protein V [Maritimibacter sp. HL-12]